MTELHAGNEHRQLHHVASVEGQFDDALVLYDGAYRGVFRAQDDGRGRYVDREGVVANLEFEVGAHLCACVNPLVVDLVCLEALEAANDVVVPHIHQGKRVVPGLVGCGHHGDTRRDIGDGYRGAGDDGLGLVSDQALNGLGNGLSRERGGEESRQNDWS